MGRATGWLRRAGVGFGRSVVLAAAALVVPALSLTLPFIAWVLGDPWSWRNVWSWIGLLIIVCVVALVFARPIGRVFRRFAARWAGVSIAEDYLPATQPVQLSTGHWWNGRSYERTRRDAELDERWRRRWTDPAYWRDVRWLAIAAVLVAPICAVPMAALVAAAVTIGHGGTAAVLLGLLFVLATVATAPYAWWILRPTADRWLRLSDRAALTERLRTVEAQRADATAAQAAEIRRIERDLHDGAQARLIAVGLSLATAERLMDSDPERAKALLREARAGTTTSLAELRELVRGVNPPVLVERGLVDAVRALALDSPLQVSVESTVRGRFEAPVEAALYFSVAELLANVSKHAPMARVVVSIRHHNGTAVITVEDNGPGGAAVLPGGGLDGIGRRLRSFDGNLTLDSPTGGPTTARMELSCALL